MTKTQQQVAAFAFGVVFVITLLTLAIVVPEPKPFQYTVFRIVLAIATAGVAGMVPGFLHAEIPGWIRSGGALAVFVIVYFYNPATLVIPEVKSRADGSTSTVAGTSATHVTATQQQPHIESQGTQPTVTPENATDKLPKASEQTSTIVAKWKGGGYTDRNSEGFITHQYDIHPEVPTSDTVTFDVSVPVTGRYMVTAEWAAASRQPRGPVFFHVNCNDAACPELLPGSMTEDPQGRVIARQVGEIYLDKGNNTLILYTKGTYVPHIKSIKVTLQT